MAQDKDFDRFADNMRMSLYVPRNMHTNLKEIAFQENRSLNQQIIYMLISGESVDAFYKKYKDMKREVKRAR